MNYKIVFALGAACLLSGCSTYSVLYDSYPQSAKIVCNGVHIGETPYTDTFELTEELEMRGVIGLNHCEAQWVSGAKSAYPAQVTINESGASYVLANRPQASGLDSDIQYDSERKKQKVEAERLRLAQEHLMLEEQRLHEMQMFRLEEERRHREEMRRHEKMKHDHKKHDSRHDEPRRH